MSASRALHVRSLYRQHLRLAALFDREAGLKALLRTSELAVTRSAPASAQEVVCVADHYRSRFFGGATADLAGASGAAPAVYRPATSLRAFVTQAFREATSGLVVPGGTDIDVDDGAKLQAAFNLARELTALAEVQAGVHASGDAVVPPLPPACQMPLGDAPDIRPGVLMLEHPAAVKPGRSVVLIYDIAPESTEEDAPWLLRGYVVNRPFPSTVAAVTKGTGLGRFGELTLFHGGMDGEALSVVHRFGELEGAVALDETDTLFVGGGIEAINRLLETGRATHADFKVFMGETIIRLGRDEQGGLSLPDEGQWYYAGGPAVAPIALQPPLFDTEGRFRDGKGLGVADEMLGYNYARFWHQNCVWAGCMRALGTATAEQAAAAGDADAAARGREIASFARLHAATAHYAHALGPLVVKLNEDLV